MNADSLKHKFYRWFPDLNERFAKDKNNFYRPRAGHEIEMRYREEMRARDGRVLVRKRETRRRENLGLGKRALQLNLKDCAHHPTQNERQIGRN